jgi:hypothetical protein
LRGIRVYSKQDLRARIELYLQEVNEEPVVFKWKYKLEMLPAVGGLGEGRTSIGGSLGLVQEALGQGIR